MFDPPPGALIEYPADDPERARRFWSELLGSALAPREERRGTGWEGAVSGSGASIGVHPRGRGPGDTAGLAYFDVDDLAEALDRVRNGGGSVVHPGGRWAVCRDSEGNPFGLHQRD